MIKELISKWKFFYCSSQEDISDAWKKEKDDSSWSEVFVPHDWSITMPFCKDFTSGTGYLAGGAAWYRTRMVIQPGWYGKKVILVFEGVYKHAKVWCNGVYLGTWANGYTEFRFDISEFISTDSSDIILAVYVEHKETADSRWYTGSGIHRRVYIKINEPVYINENEVQCITSMVNQQNVRLLLQSQISNTTKQAVQCELHYELFDKSQKLVASLNKELLLMPDSKAESKETKFMANPQLWSNTNPSLYTLKLSLYMKGECIDTYEQVCGIREVIFDPEEGIHLNHEPIQLKGVCIHDDCGCLGTVTYESVWLRRLIKLKEAGCNAIRMSHNPHDDIIYELCDRLGLMVVDELFDEWEGPKNKWWNGHNVYPPKYFGYNQDFLEWHERDMESVICKNRKHPSIIMWSIGNEIDYPNDPYCHPDFPLVIGNNDTNKPEEERIYNPNKPNARRIQKLAKHLTAIVHSLDLSRPVTMAFAFPELSSKLGIFEEVDVLGFNYKEELYSKMHAAFPDKMLYGSENNHFLSCWNEVMQNKYVGGQFLWTGIDFLGEATMWPYHGSQAGLLSLAGFCKPEYYYRKSLWCKEPMLHMVTTLYTGTNQNCLNNEMTEQWNYSDNATVIIRVFTNLKQIRIHKNDKLIVNLTTEDNIYQSQGYFQIITEYETGYVCVDSPCNPISYRLSLPYAGCRLQANVWKSELIKNDDVCQIEVTVVDQNGLPVVNNHAMITAEVCGDATLLGIENGDLADNTEYALMARRAYQGRVIVYVKKWSLDNNVTVLINGEELETLAVSL